MRDPPPELPPSAASVDDAIERLAGEYDDETTTAARKEEVTREVEELMRGPGHGAAAAELAAPPLTAPRRSSSRTAPSPPALGANRLGPLMKWEGGRSAPCAMGRFAIAIAILRRRRLEVENGRDGDAGRAASAESAGALAAWFVPAPGGPTLEQPWLHVQGDGEGATCAGEVKRLGIGFLAGRLFQALPEPREAGARSMTELQKQARRSYSAAMASNVMPWRPHRQYDDDHKNTPCLMLHRTTSAYLKYAVDGGSSGGGSGGGSGRDSGSGGGGGSGSGGGASAAAAVPLPPFNDVIQQGASVPEEKFRVVAEILKVVYVEAGGREMRHGDKPARKKRRRNMHKAMGRAWVAPSTTDSQRRAAVEAASVVDGNGDENEDEGVM